MLRKKNRKQKERDNFATKEHKGNTKENNKKDTMQKNRIGIVCHFLTTDYTDKRDASNNKKLYHKSQILSLKYNLRI
jgi:hypothetical protein